MNASKLYTGTGTQTKTYMHHFVESPDGSKYAFRYFPGEDQPEGRAHTAWPCEVWVCNSDFTGHVKAFTSPQRGAEHGHGSDAIVWVNNDRLFYAGTAYEISSHTVVWQFPGDEGNALPRGWGEPVGETKLYANIRLDPDTKGFYWLDPSAPSRPDVHLVTDMRDLVDCYGGAIEDAQATYIYRNPGDTKLFVVLYDGRLKREFGFVLNSDGSIHHDMGPHGEGNPTNGHVVWFDDTSLIVGNGDTKRFDIDGNLLERLAPWGGHISLSVDREWWAGDSRDEVRLYRYGTEDYVTVSGTIERFGDYHPSFSRDGRALFFQGRETTDPHQAVFRVDISALIG